MLQGTVTFVSPVAATGAGSGTADYLVRVSVDSASDRLRLGMTARMSIELESRTGAISVPYDALQTDAEGNYYLQILEEDGSVRDTYVELGLASAYYVKCPARASLPVSPWCCRIPGAAAWKPCSTPCRACERGTGWEKRASRCGISSSAFM